MIFHLASVQASNKFKIIKRAKLNQYESVKLNSVVKMKRRLNSGLSIYQLSFAKKNGLVFPLKILVKAPFVNEELIKASLKNQTSRKVIYEMVYQSNLLDEMLISANIPLMKNNIYVLPLEAAFNPSGLETQFYVLKNGQINLIKKTIIKNIKEDLIVFSQNIITNILITNKSFVYPGLKINENEVSFEQ